MLKNGMMFTGAVLLVTTFFGEGWAIDETTVNLVSDPEFKQTASWRLEEGYRIEPAGGKDGRTALFIERTNPVGKGTASTALTLTADRTYEVGVLVKGEDVHGGDRATLAVEFEDANGKFLDGGVYPAGMEGTFDWTWVREKIYVPVGRTSGRLLLYLRPKTQGKAWFSQPYVREVAGDFDAYLLCPAMPSFIESGKRSLIFGLVPPCRTRPYQCRVALWRDGKEVDAAVWPVRNCRVECPFEIPVGDLEFRLALFENGRTVGDVKIPSRGVVKRDGTQPVQVDDRGRTLVNGKKFFPIGLYFQHSDPRVTNRDLKTDLKIVAASSFNCVMPYDGLNWRTNLMATPGIAEIRKLLDYCNSLNLKVIFSVKDIRSESATYDGVKGERAVITHIINSLKDHAAILAWYVADEDPIKLRPEFVARNTFINQLDPTHPTWAAYCEFNQKTVYYGGGATIYGLDPYAISSPFGGFGENSQGMVAAATEAARNAFGHRQGMAYWVVPQIFNWGVYQAPNDPIKFREFRYPTETEMRSMILLSLIGGAKGVIMYSFLDLHAGPDKDQFKKRWPEVCRVAKLLSDLQGYVLGDPAAPEVKVEVKAGDVRAAGFTNDANSHAIIISSIGPGASEAVIHLGTGQNLQSLFGRSVKRADGSWLFKGQNIDSDVLLPVTKE